METATQNLQAIVHALVKGDVPLAEIRELTRHPAALVRTNALNALVKHARTENEALHDIVCAAKDSLNGVRLMGTISVAHVAVGCLYQVATPAALKAASDLLAAWPEPDRGDLLWYLRSEQLAAV